MLKDQIKKLIEEKIRGTECFLVEVKISPSKIMVYLDKSPGISLDDCITMTRYLQEQLDSTDVLEQYELEVSSPGLDEPFKVAEQYGKNIGEEVSVVTFDGMKHTGILRK